MRGFGWCLLGCLVGGLGFLKLRAEAYEPQSGDVIFQSLPRSELAEAIEQATDSSWSHCGLICRNAGGEWVVLEANAGVEETQFHKWIQRSRKGRYAVWRLKEEYRKHIPAMLREARNMMGRPYDSRYRMDDERIYCSELVYKAYLAASGESMGELVALGELSWEPFERLIRRLEGGAPPLKRVMITPRHLSEAEQLELIFSHPL